MVSYIGLGISIAIIILLAIIVYFCCCRKDKRNVPPVDGQVQHEVPPSANLIPPSDGPVSFMCLTALSRMHAVLQHQLLVAVSLRWQFGGIIQLTN